MLIDILIALGIISGLIILILITSYYISPSDYLGTKLKIIKLGGRRFFITLERENVKTDTDNFHYIFRLYYKKSIYAPVLIGKKIIDNLTELNFEKNLSEAKTFFLETAKEYNKGLAIEKLIKES